MGAAVGAVRLSADVAGGGGSVLELRPQPVPVLAEVDVRWALLD